MKPRRFNRFLTAASLVALLAGSAQAIILPPMDDTSGTRTLPPAAPPKAPLTSASGIATTLPVSRTRTALIRFDAGTAGISAASVTQARLTIYIPSVKVRGALSFHVVNQDWSETFVEKARPLPALAPAFVTLPSASVVQKQFIVLDVTTQVKAWLAAPSTDFGFAVASPDGVASLALSSKEGPASGPAAVLEIDTDVSSGTAPVAGSTGTFTGALDVGSTFVVQPRPNNTGANNIFAGSGAGASNTSGIQNTFMGANSGFANTTGGGNAFFGTQAGSNNTIGNSVTFIGNFAGLSNTTGNSNTFVGAGAGQSNTTGSGNIALGQIAGIDLTTGNNNIAIGNRGVAGDSGLIRIGTPGTHTATLLAGKVVIGSTTTNPAATLSVNGQIETLAGGVKFPDGSVQTKAAPGTGATSQFLRLGPGAFVSDDSTIRVVNNFFDGVWATGGSVLAPVQLPSGAQIISIKAFVNDTAPGANLVVSLSQKVNSNTSSNESANFEVLAGSSGFFNQTFVGGGTVDSGANGRSWFLEVSPNGSGWPGNATLSIQNIEIEWRMP